jgi:hypothetical protein
MKKLYLICNHCNDKAFELLKMPVAGELHAIENFRLLDGSTSKSCDPIICGTCKKSITQENLTTEKIKMETIKCYKMDEGFKV